jgi:hypothetical protein
MTGKIDIQGQLEIERYGKMKPAFCPFANTSEIAGSDGITWPHHKSTHCGDWCPLFREPLQTSGSGIPQTTTLQLCHGENLVFDSFADDRIMQD